MSTYQHLVNFIQRCQFSIAQLDWHDLPLKTTVHKGSSTFPNHCILNQLTLLLNNHTTSKFGCTSSAEIGELYHTMHLTWNDIKREACTIIVIQSEMYG